VVDASFEQSYCRSKLIASTRAAMIVKLHGLPNEDRLDLCQEGLLELWVKSPRFNSSRASWRTYAERVVSNRLASCIRSVDALRRGHGLHDSLDEIKRVPLAGDDRCELRVDVRKVLARVSRFDRAVALSLIDNSPSETSEILGVARSSIYRAIERLRVAFTAGGFAASRSRLIPAVHSDHDYGAVAGHNTQEALA
jgi:RNA polymerase sigma factor (sigma-70 family)